MSILYIALKHVIWRFRIYNYFREIFKFRDFMNTLRNFTKSVFAHIFAKSKNQKTKSIMTDMLPWQHRVFNFVKEVMPFQF